MNQPGGRSISAVKKYRDKPRGGANVEHKRLLSLSDEVLRAKGISKEVNSVIGRWLVYAHLTPLEAEAARRYAFIMARFDKHFTEGRRTAKSPSYERAFGSDQELERRAVDGTIGDYEAAAKKARRHYDKLAKVMGIFADPLTKRNALKNALDEMCCEDIEPPSAYREQIAAALRHVAEKFGVTSPGRGRPRKGRR